MLKDLRKPRMGKLWEDTRDAVVDRSHVTARLDERQSKRRVVVEIGAFGSEQFRKLELLPELVGRPWSHQTITVGRGETRGETAAVAEEGEALVRTRKQQGSYQRIGVMADTRRTFVAN